MNTMGPNTPANTPSGPSDPHGPSDTKEEDTRDREVEDCFLDDESFIDPLMDPGSAE